MRHWIVLALAAWLPVAATAELLTPRPKEFVYTDTIAVGFAEPIVCRHPDARPAAELLAAELGRWRNRPWPVTGETAATGGFRLEIDPQLGRGVYRIEGTALTGGDGDGLFAAVQTLLSVLGGGDAQWSADAVEFPAVSIYDFPDVTRRAVRSANGGTEAELRALARLQYNVLVTDEPDEAWRALAGRYHFTLAPVATAAAYSIAARPDDARHAAQDAALRAQGGLAAPEELQPVAAAMLLTTMAEALWNPDQARDPSELPVVAPWFDLLCDRPTRVPANRTIPLEPPSAEDVDDAIEVNFKGVTFRVTRPLVLGGWPEGDWAGGMRRTLSNAAPLTVRSADGATQFEVTDIDTPLRLDRPVLYTAAHGATTRTMRETVEWQIVDGRVRERFTDGDSRIPQRGWVLALHGAAAATAGSELRPGSAVEILSTDGRAVALEAPEAVTEYAPGAVIDLGGARLNGLFFWHDTGLESAPARLVEVTAVYADGERVSWHFDYGTELLYSGDPQRVAGPLTWIAQELGSEPGDESVSVVTEWHNPRPEQPLARLELELTAAGQRTGYRLWGLTALP